MKIIPYLLIGSCFTTILIWGCKKKEEPAPEPVPCNYVQWTGESSGCKKSGSYAVSDILCCPEGYPFSFEGSSDCYATCQKAAELSGGKTIYRYNDNSASTTGGSTTNGSTTGGSTTGGTTTGGNTCPSTNSSVGIISAVFNNMCGTTDFKVTFKNNNSQRLAIKISIKKIDGTWNCGVATPVAGATDSYYACKSTDNYTIKSMLYADWLVCGFGSACP